MPLVRGFYGAHPLQLLILAASFAVASYAGLHLLAAPSWPLILAWFVGAVIGHDLVLFPLYALADRAIRPLTEPERRRRVPVINHLRVLTLGTLLTFLLFFPGIIRQGAGSFQTASGLEGQPYLARWLLLVAALFATSALLHTARLALTGRTNRHADAGTAR